MWAEDKIVSSSYNAAPAVAADGPGNIYLAYQGNTGLVVLRRRADGVWDTVPELIDVNGDVPALAIDSENNLFITWGGNGCALKERLFIDDTWGVTETLGDRCEEPDLIVDQNDMPQVIAGGYDSGGIYVNGGASIQSGLSSSVNPTIAAGPTGTLVAIWDAKATLNSSNHRLYLSTYNPFPNVTKHYYAAGQRLATRVNGDLYYLLGDHLGSTTVVVDAQGEEAGHVLYDPFGQVVENTLPPGLTDRLFSAQPPVDRLSLG